MDPPTLSSRNWDVEQLSVGLTIGTETRLILNMCKYIPLLDAPNQLVQQVLNSPRIQALTPEWHDVHGKILSATSMAAVRGENKYCTPARVFRQKTLRTRPFTGNYNTRWGNMHEAEAAAVYQHLTGLPLVEGIGFLIHPYRKDGEQRYGATPDFITFNGIIVEIKCPVQRKIGHFVPELYMAQLQMQMEVANLSTAHFVQYVPHTLLSDGELDITVVLRDPSWWAASLLIFDPFWDSVIAYFRNHGLQLGERRDDLVWKEPIRPPVPVAVCNTSQVFAIIEFDHPTIPVVFDIFD